MAADKGGRRCGAGRPSGRSANDAGQDGVRDPAQARLGQGQCGAVLARGARTRSRGRAAALHRRRHHRRGRVPGAFRERHPRGRSGGRRAAHRRRLRPRGHAGGGAVPVPAGPLSIMGGDERQTANEFMLVYDGFDPSEEGLREALTSTGNGYFCIRGAAEWEEADDVHYPGTYAHSVYNRQTTILRGHPVPNEDRVNLPSCSSLRLRSEGEEPIRLANVELLSYRHAYDVRHALLTRELRFRDRAGRETTLVSRRFVSMGRMHLAAVAWELVAENWAGRVEVLSTLDGRVVNRGVARYRQLEGRHHDPLGPRIYARDVI